MRSFPENDLEQRLRDGLRGLPVPTISADFDARVLASLRVSPPWWQRLWQPAQPLLAGASFSLVVTLALLHWTLAAPIVSSHLAPPVLGAGGPSALATHPAPSLDALLDRPNLSAASLSGYGAAPLPPLPAGRPPEPRRRSQTFRRPPLIA